MDSSWVDPPLLSSINNHSNKLVVKSLALTYNKLSKPISVPAMSKINRTAIDAYKARRAQNVFSVNPAYTMDFDFREPQQLLRYNAEVEQRLAHETYLQAYQSMIPAFQRDNNKWTREQQIRFVENVCAGFKTTLMLYTLHEDEGLYEQVKILDGLQRLTAILAFIENQFPIFGEFYFRDIDSRLAFSGVRPNVRIYTFGSELEAVQFYIEMNRGITHSSEDIERAEKYRQSLLATQLP